MTNAPRDPFSELTAAAMSVHELFITYVDVGFTREEALRLIIAMIQNSPGL
jgi:hypothetical protein